MRRYIPVLLLALTVATAVACDENLSSIAGPDTPDLEPTFASVQKDILQTAETGTGRRACISCHTANGRTPSGGLNMDVPDPYAVLVNGPSTRNPGQIFIVPGNPDASYVVKKLEGASGIVGGRMPLGGPYLKAGQLQILRRWIEIGAPRN